MKKILVLAIAVCGSIGVQAFAGPVVAPAAPTQTLSFEDLQTACKNPTQFHNQQAPTNIQISCASTKTVWILDPSALGQSSAPNSELVTASVMSDKYSVDVVNTEVPMAPQSLACNTYKQVTQHVEAVRALTCDEVVAYKGSLNEYCGESVTALVRDNASALVQADTGQTYSQCGVAQSIKR